MGEVVNLWATDSEYSPHHFYTRGSDKHGHREEVRVKVPPYVHGQIVELVHSGRIPAYRSFGDVGRDALVHRLHWLADNADDPRLRDRLSAGMALHLMEAKVAEYRDTLTRVNALIESIGTVAEEAIRHDDHAGLLEQLRFYREQATILREPFQSKLLSMIAAYERRVTGVRH